MKSLLSWLVFILVVSAAIFSIPWLLRLVLGTPEPMLTVTSESMWPQLTRGDLVLVKSIDLADIQPGMVVVFEHSGGLAVHRVVRVEGPMVTTKGDANSAEDPPFPDNAVMGKAIAVGGAVFKIPWLGKISLMLNPEPAETPAGSEAPPESLATRILRGLASPLGVILIIIFLLIIFESYVRAVYYKYRPGSMRARRQRVLFKRLARLRGEDRARRALRM